MLVQYEKKHPLHTCRRVSNPLPTQQKPLCLTYFLLLFFSIGAIVQVHRLSHAVTNESRSSSILHFPSHYSPHSIPLRIFQTWREPTHQISSIAHQEVASTWTELNPDHRYELLSDTAATNFVHSTFRSGIPALWDSLAAPVLRADLLRYLLMYAVGGVYSDFDTACRVPIKKWLAGGSYEHAQVIVGIEWDQLDDSPLNGAFVGQIQIVQWTLMAAPRHPFYARVINEAAFRLQELAKHRPYGERLEVKSYHDAINTTGPWMFTDVLYEHLTDVSGKEFGWRNLSRLHEPLLVDDILILPMASWSPLNNGIRGVEATPAGLVEHLGYHTWGSW